MEVPLKYYFANNWKVCVNFDKYTIDKNGVIRNKATREALSYAIDEEEYQGVGVQDASGKSRNIRVARAIASTFIGSPPSSAHTADHIDQIRENNIFENIRWSTKKEQSDNRTMPGANKSAFIIIRDSDEKMNKEWVEYLKNEKNHMSCKYTENMIAKYAQKKQHGFAYKMYPDLEGEVWKDIEGSKTSRGMWMISNMCRVKYVTNHAENVLERDRLGLMNGYPKIRFNNKDRYLHVVSFMTFFPDEWANKKPEEMVLHKEDDQMDFRPEMLRLGTRSENGKDAHDNGKHDGTLRARQKCASYIKGVFEKEHKSQEDAAEYLILIGYEKASHSAVGKALRGDRKTAYGRTWVLV